MVATVPAGKIPYAYFDLCFYEYCNFTCYYCRHTNEGLSKGKGAAAVTEAISDFLELNSAGVFKVSGYGEAALWDGLPEVVRPWADHFPTFQLISNGTARRRIVDALAEHPNFQVCITLDGHLPELTRFRTKLNPKLHQLVVDKVDYLLAGGVPVELNCVVTQANAARMGEYLDWAGSRWGDRVRIMPFPVRPFYERELDDIVDDLVATPEDVTALEAAVVGRHAEYAGLLPPRVYLERLVEFLRLGARPWRCHVHRANFGVNPKLEALACACAGDTHIEELGNALGPIRLVGRDEIIEQRRATNRVEGKVGPRCRTCFTHYEIINLYFEDAVSEQEIARIPSLSAPGTLAHLRTIKHEMQPHLVPVG